MEKMMSTRDAIVYRGMWYVLTLLSLFGLYKSIDQLWSRSRFLAYGAVSATTSYAVMLFKYLFFTDHPSISYKEFLTFIEKLPQAIFSYLALEALLVFPCMYTVLTREFSLSVSLLTISLFSGGIGLIQLSDKFRMEMRHALLTLFLGCLICVCSFFTCSSFVQGIARFTMIIYGLHGQSMLILAFLFSSVYRRKVYSNLHYHKVDSDTLTLPLLYSSTKL